MITINIFRIPKSCPVQHSVQTSEIKLWLLLLMQLHARIKSEPNAPYLRVKIGNVQSGVNNSVFDLSENQVVVERGNTVQFICERNDDLE